MHLEIDLLADREDNEYTDNKVFVRAGEPYIRFHSSLLFKRLFYLNKWIIHCIV